MSIRFCKAFVSGLKSRRLNIRNESNNVVTNCMSDADLTLLWYEVPETLHNNTID